MAKQNLYACTCLYLSKLNYTVNIPIVCEHTFTKHAPLI